MSRLGVVAVAVVLALCCAAEVRAQPSGAGAPESSYAALVRDGADEFGRGNFVEARALFEQAHAREPSARTLRGLGLCAYELKRHRQAIRELEAALADPRKPLSEAQRTEVRTAIDKARRYVGTLRLEVEPADATVAIDGQPTSTRELELDAGDYMVAASAPGYHSSERRVSVSGGQRETARIVLTSASTHGAAPDGATGDSDRGRTSNAWPWVVSGVSGAVMIGGGVLLALALDDVSTVEHADKGTPFSELEPAYDGAPLKSAIGFAMLGVGAAGLTVGLIWGLGSSEQESVQVAVGHDRVVVGGRF